jgi:hypothetical protein
MKTFLLKSLTFAAALSVFCCVFPSSGVADEASGKINFLIFVADDLNKEYYGCYGNDKTASPTVSRLAKQGMVFDNAFTGMAICSPSG